MRTPDTLRQAARLGKNARRVEAIDACANAWELDINLKHIALDQVARVIQQNDALRKRMEEVEEELRLTAEMETKLNDECVELSKRLEAVERKAKADVSYAAAGEKKP